MAISISDIVSLTGNPKQDLGHQCADTMPYYKFINDSNASDALYIRENPEKTGLETQVVNVYKRMSMPFSDGSTGIGMRKYGTLNLTGEILYASQGTSQYTYDGTSEKIVNHYINKWSLRKPTYSSKIGSISNEDMIGNKTKQGIYYGMQVTAYNIKDVHNIVYAYNDRNILDGTSCARITDFIDYNPNATPSLTGKMEDSAILNGLFHAEVEYNETVGSIDYNAIIDKIKSGANIIGSYVVIVATAPSSSTCYVCALKGSSNVDGTFSGSDIFSFNFKNKIIINTESEPVFYGDWTVTLGIVPYLQNNFFDISDYKSHTLSGLANSELATCFIPIPDLTGRIFTVYNTSDGGDVSLLKYGKSKFTSVGAVVSYKKAMGQSIFRGTSLAFELEPEVNAVYYAPSISGYIQYKRGNTILLNDSINISGAQISANVDKTSGTYVVAPSSYITANNGDILTGQLSVSGKNTESVSKTFNITIAVVTPVDPIIGNYSV